MNIEPDIKVENDEVINNLIEEAYRFIEEVEQQLREKFNGFNQQIELDDMSRAKVTLSAENIKR